MADIGMQAHPLLRGFPPEKLRSYDVGGCCVFWLTSTEYGHFSNMADGFPLDVSGLQFGSSEALYQACRFPDFPHLQVQIASAPTPKIAKKLSREAITLTRADWKVVRVNIMRWVLRVKAAQHKKEFLFSLVQTGEVPIVEESTRDAFWGAVRVSNALIGVNALGRLLMELRRDSISDVVNLMSVSPPDVPDFRILGSEVGVVVPARR